MKQKKLIAILTAIFVLALALNACGNKETPAETTAAPETSASQVQTPSQPLELTSWNMSASTWSSPNGATIHISATPSYYAEGQSAAFVVRLESDEIATIPCSWDGSSYSASADLNAANGYCYYVILTAADGTSTEVAVNTPAAPTHEAFINMEASLESYCSIIVEESQFGENQLILTSGKVQVQAPVITNEGETIACQEATLILSYNGEELGKKVLPLTQAETAGLFEAALDNVVFEIPAMEADQSVELTMTAVLTNEQILNAFGGNWFYSDEGLLPVVG